MKKSTIYKVLITSNKSQTIVKYHCDSSYTRKHNQIYNFYPVLSINELTETYHSMKRKISGKLMKIRLYIYITHTKKKKMELQIRKNPYNFHLYTTKNRYNTYT